MLEFTLIEGGILALGAMIAGLILLVKGGDWTIESAVYLAKHWGVSPMVIGFTIVGFGTSLPELVVSVIANFQGSPGIALGNVVGSNIANILMILATVAIISTVTARPANGMFRDLVMMIAATVLLLVLLQYGEIGRMAGLVMVLILAGYVFWQYRKASVAEDEADSHPPAFGSKGSAYMFLLAGLICVAIGAEFLVRGSKVGAGIIGVPEAIIGLSIIALGTSLPELTTSIIAARKGHSDIILGNIIGSNVFNVLGIIGLTAVLKPIERGSFEPQIASFDIWVALVVALVFSLLLVVYKKVDRPVGLVFCTAYLAYNIYIYAANMGS